MFFQEMAGRTQTCLRDQMPARKARSPGQENGPGESKHSHIGISLPGTFEEPVAPVYVDGRLFKTLRGEAIVAEFNSILDGYVARRYGGGGRSTAAPS